MCMTPRPGTTVSAKSFMDLTPRTNNYNRNLTKLHFADMQGKMESGNGIKIMSLSTSCIMNERCVERATRAYINGDADCVCYHCFAIDMLCNSKMDRTRDGMTRNLANNQEILTKGFLNWDSIPVFEDVDFMRFESHGDLNNVIQLINYIAIALKSLLHGAKTHFTLWSKNLDILRTAFDVMKVEKPSNMTIIYSSHYVNRVEDVHDWFIDKVFTVWNDEQLAIDIGQELNCCKPNKDGLNRCNSCQICYTHNDTRYVNEWLRPTTNTKA